MILDCGFDFVHGLYFWCWCMGVCVVVSMCAQREHVGLFSSLSKRLKMQFRFQSSKHCVMLIY